MTERKAKTHFLANTNLSSILEPERDTSHPAYCKGERLCTLGGCLHAPDHQDGCLLMRHVAPPWTPHLASRSLKSLHN